MSTSKLPEGTWYKPTKRFVFNGEHWNTNKYLAIVGDADAEDENLFGVIRSMLARCTKKTGLNRGMWVTTDTGGVFATYLIDLIEQILGSDLRWMVPPSDDMGPMAAYLGDRPVAIVMPHRGVADECPCPWCSGKGFSEECVVCDGNGRVSHECTCGMLHEHDCDECDGEGGIGTCQRCGGSKVYRGQKARLGDLATGLKAMAARQS